ncbi:hypothetical protein D3C72_1247300 [compost metagenome]
MKQLLWSLTTAVSLLAMPAFAQDGAVRILIREIYIEMPASQQQDAVNQIERHPTSHGAYPGRFPEGSTHRLLERELVGLSCPSLWVMRNEIYARHGRPFRVPAVLRYFQVQPWYAPDRNYNLATDDTLRLTTLEKQNVGTIRAYEKKCGCPF